MERYAAGALLIYGRTGVCRVESLTETKRSDGTRQSCYVLQPLYQSYCITIPVDSQAVFIRMPVSATEARALIDALPAREAEPYYNRNINQLRDHYRGQLERCSCEDLALFVLSLYRKRREVLASGKKFGAVDERFLKEAEDLLCGELGAALNIGREEARALLEPAR